MNIVPSLQDTVAQEDALHTVVAVDHVNGKVMLEDAVGRRSPDWVDFADLDLEEDALGTDTPWMDADTGATTITHSRVWTLLS
ncbi:MAG: hypothetical protein UT33_C0011G0032 [Candidatus Peregrinibacteria bacterium GW2011_GWC2_39_14]|nr:MAG: hypothetical protein UT33_C0011G0032 [Candidatus Peregrinibacteria bacterium GW2011_GWC2_39_14]